MPKCALPDHLKDKKHNDWIWPLSYIPRSANAKGPRCGKGKPGYLSWPPHLIEGYDVTRWEWSDRLGNHTHGIINDFKNKKINSSIYQSRWDIKDLNTGKTHKNVDLIHADWWPSIIQEYSEYGWLKLDPTFQCGWRTKPWWKKYYWRWGWRPDFDYYYNWGPYAGRNFE
jgi:hypothetical protein